MNKGYAAPPLSIVKIRSKAMQLRRLLGLGSGQVDMIDIMEKRFSEIDKDFSYDISDEKYMYENNYEAHYDPSGTTLVIRDDVYDIATDENSNSLRHQFTLAHEFGHYLLHRGLSPVLPRSKMARVHKRYEDTEWQADTFAGEFLMPFDTVVEIIRNNDGGAFISINNVANHFDVSWDAARVRVDKVLKELNR